ncbi:uncharacterized protein LOC105768937 isoform X1 [Gossypium raimondii]|uniref:uncharacterized protein LOC105768937 isoform X1 n=1 Tax=Gossypium raimondii TaxID=29730 RepID=UPI00063A9F2B|nr:uncharacterized protein LOC105768937 isoform X1 [Gossypium raimondii]
MTSVEERRIVIRNDHGENLVGILRETGSKDLVIICHGFQSKKERIPMVTLATTLGREGISAFRFDFAGNGESEGSFMYGNYRREAEDLRAVIRHFRKNQRLITAIVGHSKGFLQGGMWCFSMLQSTMMYPPSSIFLAGSIWRKAWKVDWVKIFYKESSRMGLLMLRIEKFEYRVTQESLMDRLTTDTRAACLSIDQNCRLLTIHGSRDKIVPAKDALEFARFIRNHKLHIIEGADHEYTAHQDELATVVLDFVKAVREDRNTAELLQSCERAVNFIKARI